MNKFYFLLFATSLSLLACKTAIKSYNKGDYADAIELGVKKLNKDPYDSDTKELIKSAYRFAVTDHENNIRIVANSHSDERYEAILKEYLQLQDLYETIQQYPAVAQQISATNYGEYVQTYRNRSAEVQVGNGDKWMTQQNKRAFREAYYAYAKALNYTNNMDIKRKRDEAYDAALTKVLVVPIQNYGGYSYSSGYQLQQFQNSIMRTLANNMNDGFVRFYSQWDTRSGDFTPDQVLEMNLGLMRLGQPNDQRTTREVTKQVVTKEIVYKPDSVVKQYATVKAWITTVHRTMVSEGELYISLRDTRGMVLWNDRFTGQHRWEKKFTSYTGDERALDGNDKNLTNKGNNNNSNNNNQYTNPNDEEIMGMLYQQIQADLCSRLRNHFDRY